MTLLRGVYVVVGVQSASVSLNIYQESLLQTKLLSNDRNCIMNLRGFNFAKSSDLISVISKNFNPVMKFYSINYISFVIAVK